MKDPAFLFYSGDFLIGTSFMTLEERGQYITVLCLLHQHGGCLPLAKIEKVVGTMFTPTLEKLKKNQHGYYNDRLTHEIKKRKEYSKSRSNNRLGKKKHKNICKSYDTTYDKHMENENENENRDINGVEDKKNKAIKVPKKRYLDKVKMTEDDMKKLLDTYGKDVIEDYLARLDDYIGSHGDKYKNHYYTVRSWLRRDNIMEMRNGYPVGADGKIIIK